MASIGLVLQSVPLQLPDEITNFLARAELPFEQRVQKPFEMDPHRHRQHRGA